MNNKVSRENHPVSFGMIHRSGWLTLLYAPLGYRVYVRSTLFGLLAAAREDLLGDQVWSERGKISVL